MTKKNAFIDLLTNNIIHMDSSSASIIEETSPQQAQENTAPSWEKEPSQEPSPEPPSQDTSVIPVEAPILLEKATEAPQVTCIAKGASVQGEIIAPGDVHIFGRVKGNIQAKGNLTVAGKIPGNVQAGDIDLIQCQRKGNLFAGGFVHMDEGTLLIGDLDVGSITLGGKVRGNVVSRGKIYLRESAMIIGNITGSNIAIDPGANLMGEIMITSNPNSDNLDIPQDMEEF